MPILPFGVSGHWGKSSAKHVLIQNPTKKYISPLFPNLGYSKFLKQIVKIKICLQATLYHVKLFHKTLVQMCVDETKDFLSWKSSFPTHITALKSSLCSHVPCYFTCTTTYRSNSPWLAAPTRNSKRYIYTHRAYLEYRVIQAIVVQHMTIHPGAIQAKTLVFRHCGAMTEKTTAPPQRNFETRLQCRAPGIGDLRLC